MLLCPCIAGITGTNDNLRLHGLFSWKAASPFPVSQVLSVTSEGDNLSMAKKPKFEASFGSRKDESVCAILGKQTVGTSERATSMDDMQAADNASPSDAFPVEQTLMQDDNKSNDSGSTMMRVLERRDVSTSCGVHGGLHDLYAVRTSSNESVEPVRLAVDESKKRVNASEYLRESACSTNTVECFEHCSVPVADVCSDSAPSGVIFSPDISSQSDLSSPVKCGVEVTKRAINDREVVLPKDKETKKTFQFVEQRSDWKTCLSPEDVQVQPDSTMDSQRQQRSCDRNVSHPSCSRLLSSYLCFSRYIAGSGKEGTETSSERL